MTSLQPWRDFSALYTGSLFSRILTFLLIFFLHARSKCQSHKNMHRRYEKCVLSPLYVGLLSIIKKSGLGTFNFQYLHTCVIMELSNAQANSDFSSRDVSTNANRRLHSYLCTACRPLATSSVCIYRWVPWDPYVCRRSLDVRFGVSEKICLYTHSPWVNYDCNFALTTTFVCGCVASINFWSKLCWLIWFPAR